MTSEAVDGSSASVLDPATSVVVSSSSSSSLVGSVPEWMWKALASPPFRFKGFLPVQEQVIPVVRSAMISGLHLDVCLSAPTGCGKTLCYLVPLLESLVAAKQRTGTIQLRGVVLVPANALATQVANVAKNIVKKAPIDVVVASTSDEDEGGQLVRSVTTSDGVTRWYATCDLLIATPQRLLKALLLDDTANAALPVEYLQMLILDEADDVLAGSFTALARRIVGRFERAAEGTGHVIHRMLCSATLTEHVAKVSDVRLQNTVFFSLDDQGRPIASDSAPRPTGAGPSSLASSVFSLPKRLSENLVIVDDSTRHATLLKIVRAALSGNVSTGGGEPAEVASPAAQSSILTGAPQVVLVFCAQAATARVMAKLLVSAGIKALEFTASVTEQERRKALQSAYSAQQSCCVVATDAMMRGIDMPGVRCVIMYDPPRSLQQYVHRVGRTARGAAGGASFVLLSKIGPSGKEVDGEVAVFKSLCVHLQRPNGRPPHDKVWKLLSPEEKSFADDALATARHALRVGSAKVGPPNASSAGKTALTAGKQQPPATATHDEDGGKTEEPDDVAVPEGAPAHSPRLGTKRPRDEE